MRKMPEPSLEHSQTLAYFDSDYCVDSSYDKVHTRECSSEEKHPIGVHEDSDEPSAVVSPNVLV